MDARIRAACIKLIAFDIDGVMTDGSLYYTDDGRELKAFSVQDGLGLKLLQRAGLELAIVTGRNSVVVARRAADLGIAHVFQGVADKRATVSRLLVKLGLHWNECAFMGDDLTDIPPMRAAGFSAAPSDADPEVRRIARFVCQATGAELFQRFRNACFSEGEALAQGHR